MTRQYYNLNDIMGTGLASAFIYKPIGSKYIRLPDLDKKELNIVFPSRRKILPKRTISDDIQVMIKDLVFKGDISQDAYDKLTIDDKQVFREVLEATHVQHSFRDHLADPLDSLKAEYDKLTGEIMLGNDNPSIVKQLRAVAVNLSTHKMMPESEFRAMMATI